jgi:sugar lactone lactonase YvrE
VNRTRIARTPRSSHSPHSPFSFASILAAALMTLCLAATGAGAQSNTVNLPDYLHDPADTVVWEMRIPHYCEGPAWNPATGDVTFSQIGSPGTASNRPDWLIWRINPGVDTGSLFYDKGQGNGQEIDPWGRLAVIQRDMVIRFDSTGAVDTLVKSGDNGVVFDGGLSNDQQAGNDLSFASNGAFYFTALHTRVFYVDTNGTLSVAHEGANWANGIHWIEEENAVYVHNQANIYRFDREEDGTLINRTVFANVPGMFAGSRSHVTGAR